MSEKSAYQHINEACENLGLSNHARRKARMLSEGALASPDINRTRRTIAASSVYAAGLLVNEKRTQEMVEGATGVNVQTIRPCYMQILEARGFDIRDDETAQERESMLAVMRDRVARVLQS